MNWFGMNGGIVPTVDLLAREVIALLNLYQLTTLTKGEAGNIISVIKKGSPHHYALGNSLKEMMESDNTFVFLE